MVDLAPRSRDGNRESGGAPSLAVFVLDGGSVTSSLKLLMVIRRIWVDFYDGMKQGERESRERNQEIDRLSVRVTGKQIRSI